MANWPRDEGLAYFDRAFDIIRSRSVVRQSVDWVDLHAECRELLQRVTDQSGVYAAIRRALDHLGDNHSLFLEPERADAWRNGSGATSGDRERPEGRMIASDIAYVAVPAFASGDKGRISRFADEMQSLIAQLDGPAVSKWIVDLRKNPGGNMWPMLAGVGPILGEGPVGSFIFPDGRQSSWWYRRGQAGVGSLVRAAVSGKVHQVAISTPLVAVLTGGQTASSGEAVTVAFRGRPHTRSLGAPTRGQSSGNAAFPLGDGAMLVLTMCYFADREGRVYHGPIEPDVVVHDDAPFNIEAGDRVLDAARRWLEDQ